MSMNSGCPELNSCSSCVSGPEINSENACHDSTSLLGRDPRGQGSAGKCSSIPLVLIPVAPKNFGRPQRKRSDSGFRGSDGVSGVPASVYIEWGSSSLCSSETTMSSSDEGTLEDGKLGLSTPGSPIADVGVLVAALKRKLEAIEAKQRRKEERARKAAEEAARKAAEEEAARKRAEEIAAAQRASERPENTGASTAAQKPVVCDTCRKRGVECVWPQNEAGRRTKAKACEACIAQHGTCKVDGVPVTGAKPRKAEKPEKAEGFKGKGKARADGNEYVPSSPELGPKKTTCDVITGVGARSTGSSGRSPT